MTLIARTWPYRTAGEKRLKAAPWRLCSAGTEPRDLGESLEDWDPMVDLTLSRSVVLDAAGVAADCGLPAGTPIQVAATWRATGTSVRGAGTLWSVPAEGTHAANLQVDLRGADLGLEVVLAVAVVLGATLPSRPITAWRRGSVLWEDSVTLRLEGGASRFPVEAISFAAAGHDFPEGAAWRLVWEPDDLELPVLGSVRLYLNRDHPATRLSLEHPDRSEARLVTSFMMFEVTRALIRGAVATEPFQQRTGPWPAESVGRVIDRILKTRLRGTPAAALAELAVHDPDRFDAILQARLGLLRGTER